MINGAAVDKSERYIVPGDIVVYGHALGRSAELRYGKVTKITFSNSVKYDPDKCAYDNVRVPSFIVMSVDDDYIRMKPELNKRTGMLKFGSRILRVQRNQVPSDVLALLDTIDV